jgi:hypothetical protein
VKESRWIPVFTMMIPFEWSMITFMVKKDFPAASVLAENFPREVLTLLKSNWNPSISRPFWGDNRRAIPRVPGRSEKV